MLCLRVQPAACRLAALDSRLDRSVLVGRRGTVVFVRQQATAHESPYHPPANGGDDAGHVLTAEVYGNRIQVFDGSGTFLRSFGSRYCLPQYSSIEKSVIVVSALS